MHDKDMATAQVRVCTGPVCGSFGLCSEVYSMLLHFFSPSQIREDNCMGLCDTGGAFSIDGCSYAGSDLDRLHDIIQPFDLGKRTVLERESVL